MAGCVAVIGLGCVLPGAANADEAWARWRAGSSAIRLPDPSVGFDPRPELGGLDGAPLDLRGGYAVDRFEFDWRRYRTPPADAAATNAMQFLVLEAGTQALASVRRIPRERTAIFLGATGLGFQKDGGLRVRTNELIEALASTASVRRMPAKKREAFLKSARGVFEARLKPSSSDNSVGSLASVAAARIAMHHDLCGAHYAVDADHASALAALEIARSALLDGEWDCVVVGGASELLTPVEHVAYRAAGWLSPTGRVAPFAEDADGTVLGEGVAMFALKRLEDAVRDEDPIYAILSAVRSATPEDARPPFDPGSAGIAAAISAAWAELGESPSTAQVFECNAPGIANADAAELSALTAQLAVDAAPPVVDSAAFDMGHLRAASGAASLLRAILCLHHGRLLPSPRQQRHAGLDGKLRFIHGEEPWPTPAGGQPRRAGVTSVALSGQAFHAVLEGIERKRIAPRSQPSAWQPLAIVGVGGSYSGAASAPELWTQLLAGADRVVEVPKTRWSLERYHSSDGKALERTNAKMGSFVELPRLRPEDQTPATDAPQIDPTQLLVVRVAEEAVADAGGLRDPKRTGAFIAYMPFQSRRFLADARVNARELGFALREILDDAATLGTELEAATGELFPAITAASLLGWLGSSTPTRLQRRFALGGPLIAVESACASTLAALHAAAQALRDRRCDTALVGGGYCDMAPEFYVATSRFNGLSSAGIYPFDASAQGFVPGEGAGVFVVKRLADAERDGDHIHAVVRGIGGSSDGRGRSVFTPSIEGESLALGRALGDVDAATVDYVECHGTGTPVGDATEVMSLAYSYGGARRSEPLRIGSVKSNLGHLIAAAGAPALTKSIFALEHGKIPASLHCAKPSGKIDFASARIEVVREAVDWPAPATHPRRAGVSAFGIGGSNFHVLLEEHRPTEQHAQPPGGDPIPELFVFTGGDEAACRDALAGLAAILDEASNEDFADAARASRQQALASADSMRLALVVVGPSDLARKAELVSGFAGTIHHATPLEAQGVFLGDGKPAGDVVVLFPGQGSQYADMAHALARRFPLVDALLDRADTAWRGWTGRALRTAMWPVGATWLPLDEDLHAMVFVVSCAIHAVLQSFGVRPAYFVGQSAGELAALVAAEALSFEDGLRAILARTQSVLELPLADRGAMAAVATDATALQKLLADLPGVVVVAADNCPRSSLASGETAAMQALAQRCEAAGVELTPLAVSHAYHSAVIAGAAPRYRAVLETLTWRPPKTPVLSTVDLATYDADVSRSIDRLVRQYTTPVRFSEAVRQVYERGARLFLEAGPKWPLTSYVREVLAGTPFFSHAAMHPKVGEAPQLLRLVAGAYVRGAAGLEPSTSAPQPASPVAATGTTHFARVRNALVSGLATRTGYPEDMLELDLDLEGDLGIDTVKQVEVFAAVREGLGLAPEPGLRLRDLNTLRKVIDRFVARLDGSPVLPAATRPIPPRASAPSDRFEEIRATVVTALAARTGYPEEMLELDLDLEGDLGIDTVKQVEIFGAVREGLGLALEPGVRMRDLNTLRKVIDRFVRRLEGEAHVQAPAAAARAATTEHDAARPLDRERFPALARVRAQSADRLVATRTLSLETDRYLADAQLAGRRCVPSGVALEALAEAASLLLDAEVRTAFDLKSAGPLIVGDRGECAIELEAVRVGEGRAQVTLYVLDAGSRRQVRFGGEFSASASASPVTPRAVLRALDRRGQPRNGRALSGAQTGELHLGETIGGCVWARSLSFCEVIGGIRADDDRLFYGLDRPKLALGPALLECAFMLAGFGWYALAQAVGVPVDIEHIELGRAAEPDEEVLCHVRLRGATSTTVTADLVLLGGDYQPIMSVRGCRLMQVDRMVDFTPEPDAATGSWWAHFCRALKGTGGTR